MHRFGTHFCRAGACSRRWFRPRGKVKAADAQCRGVLLRSRGFAEQNHKYCFPWRIAGNLTISGGRHECLPYNGDIPTEDLAPRTCRGVLLRSRGFAEQNHKYCFPWRIAGNLSISGGRHECLPYNGVSVFIFAVYFGLRPFGHSGYSFRFPRDL